MYDASTKKESVQVLYSKLSVTVKKKIQSQENKFYLEEIAFLSVFLTMLKSPTADSVCWRAKPQRSVMW